VLRHYLDEILTIFRLKFAMILWRLTQTSGILTTERGSVGRSNVRVQDAIELGYAASQRQMTIMAGDAQACPKCGGKEVQVVGVLKRHVNPWVFFLGGWLFSLLWSGSRKQEVRCVQCDTVFQRPTRASRIAWVLLILFILLILLGVLAQVSESQSGVEE
jgi:hypothetical protein